MSRVRLALVSLSLILVAVVCGGMQSPQAAGGPALEPHVPGEILLKFQPGARGIERASVMAQLNARHLHTFREGGEHWQLGPGRSVEQAIDTLSRNPNIEHVTPNYILTAEVVPNDPNLPQLYGMINTGQTGGTNDADIDADQAWGVTTGSHSVVVGIIDTGVDYTHPDLAANIWTNPGEIPGNMIDDDLNGFVDDIHGYDFVNNDADPFDDNGHGTHCAGTIGAVGNNGIGVVGVNWNVSIMGLKFLSASGSGSTANAVRAVNYATQMGADLTSNSWGGGGASPDLQAAIAAAGLDEIPFVAAAGNNGTNNDTSPHYPSNYNLPNVISVAASDHNDAPASFTNYGPTTVHIAAPGVNILSTQPGNRYQLLSGTSMATPHVAGVVALLKSRLPNIPAAQVRTALMIAADPVAPFGPGGSKPIISGGRLNAFFAIADPDEDPPGAVGDLAAGDPSSNSLTLSWTATGDDGSTGTATFYQIRYATSPIDETNFAMATRAGAEPNPLASGSPQSMEVKGLDYETFYYFAIKAFDEWGNAGPISNIATGTTLPAPTAGLSPTAISDALFTGQTADHTVMLRNDGVGTLDFTIPDPLVSEPLAVYPDLPLDKDEPDPRQGILGSGGPDASGYRWRDSDEPGGPGFGWTDISGVGTPIVGLDGDDEIATGIPIGFPFNFYGNSFTSVNVNTNGWLSFTDTTASGAKAYSNQPLPNSGAPANMLAVFWDDLHFRAALRAHYYNDGSRFIVQWTNVDRYDTTTPSNLTFQAILYPSGRIVYQYLSMQSAQLASATIGIQNANGTDGLTVVYNSGYVHNDLAVEFSRIPQWLTASPASGRIPAGGSMPISVHLDASGLEGGTYPGAVNIGTNDPGNPVLSVDVTLVVTGAPDAVVTPASIDFGDIFLGTPNERTLTVLNDGTDVLHVSSVSVSDPQIALAPDMFDVANHAAQQVTVTLTPSSLGPFAGSITVASDDAGQPTIVVPVTANSIPTPVVQINPASISDTLFSGNTSAHNLRVSNAGGSDLILTAGVDLGNGALGAPGVIYDDPSALGSGGPDGFGYRWKDSDEPGGPIFDFVDIRSTGTLVTFPSQDDSLSGVHSMGMDFPFYGNTFSSFKVSTNGWMTFNTTATSSVNTNTNLPSTTLPANSIALFWDDLHIRNRGTVHYLYDGLKFIIQYTDFDRFSTTQQPYPAHLTFQAHLYPSGRIIMMYETMTGFMTSATVGIHNGTRTIGLPVNFNSAYMHNNLAVQIHRTPDWLRVAPAGATVPPGSFQDFTVTLDSTDRSSGVLQGNVVLGTNIPGQETVQVPVALTVIGAPDVLTSPISHDFGTVYIGYPQLTSFYVVNNGTADLNVSDVTTTHPDLLVEDQPGPTAGFVLAPGAARLMTLRFAPSGVGLLNAAVQVHSDDPDSPTFELAVTGQSLMPPVAVHSPASFTESLNVGATVDRTLHLENQGLSDLSFDTGIRLLSGATVTVHSELELKKEDENDPRPGILGLGGPDMFGYTWEDSDASGGPVFDWVDISATGTPVAGLDADDENLGPIPIGFPFSFYGNTFTNVRVGTNGFLTFTSTLTAITNNPLPNSGSSVPENLLAAFWDDLEFRGTERARYLNDGTRFIVQYTDVDRVGTAGNSHLTFQVILYPNGRIVYQYLTMDSATLTSATIGIQNSAKNDGLTVVHNLAYAHGGLAIAFTPPFAFPSVT
ncbi:MAG TPA: S8 family serine peptidase, partial [Candidatus Polarisedimenticolia bacterium]|nr:S8 family serine peptidase [Candidatus Polarisedimenticolia bacterium]